MIILDVLKTIICCLLIFTSSRAVVAQEQLIGINVGYGNVGYEVVGVSQDGDAFVGDVYFRQSFTPSLGVELGYRSASQGIGSALVSPLTRVTDMTYGGPRLSSYVGYPCGGGFEIYGKGGVTYYELGYTLEQEGARRDFAEARFGGEVAVGITLGGSHFAWNIEYGYTRNSVFDASMFMSGVQYKF